MRERDLDARFENAVDELTRKVQVAGLNVTDEDTDAEVRHWLNGNDTALDWIGPGISGDEWFFITTLYGTMSLAGQRTHIRKFFPLFVALANRDIRSFTPQLLSDWRLRQPWMKGRLCRMAEILRESGRSMTEYVARLIEIERQATPEDPMPALQKIMWDHGAGEGKTLSVFVRDCVKGNCFPIDSRVAKQVKHFGLPASERELVALCIRLRLNPRQTARIFYRAPAYNEVMESSLG